MKIFRKSVLILLVLVMILAMAVPSMAASQNKQLKSIIIYRSVERVTTEMLFATVAADEVTKTKETISFPGY